MSKATRILERINDGDPVAASELLPLIYEELRKLAANQIRQEKSAQTLDATALVHEAYLRLVDVQEQQSFNSRGHFFSAAARAMRRILVEKARKRRSIKRGGKLVRRDLDPDQFGASIQVHEILEINESLERFSSEYPQIAELVELRFFAGLSLEDAAAVLEINPRTAYRHWVFAKAWLRSEMQDGTGHGG